MRSKFFERIKSSGAPVIPLITGPAVEAKTLNYKIVLYKRDVNLRFTYANELLIPANVTLSDANSFYIYAS
jgi:hypothetical protein